MSPTAALDLSPGVKLLVNGAAWTVESLAAQYGQVLLRGEDGQCWRAPIRLLVNDPGCRVPMDAHAAAYNRGRQPAGLDDLTAEARERVHLRAAHMLEAETGFRSGDARRALPGEPRAGYDPRITTLAGRRDTKVAELRALGPDEARVLGLARVSERTLRRWAAAYHRFGLLGCADGRMLRRSGDRPSITEPVREAIFAVRQETLHRSKISMRARERLIHQYIRERFDPDVVVPSYPTLRRVWRQWFGPGGARQRYAHSGARVEPSGAHAVVHRPGQVVALDTTVLPVKVRDGVFGEPVSTYLTLAMDVYTHSLVAFRLTLVSDTSVDVAMLLRDVMMPLPLREDWGADMEWPYPGIPAAVVAEFAGHRVAGLPFFTPETVTTDHGSVYKNHHLVEVQRVIGANILPSRVLRPTDKHAVERAFGGLRALLFEHLLGYTGVDVADRGVDPEADAVLTVTAMEHLIATWVVKIWQNRELGEHAPSWDPTGQHSPNTLFAAALVQGGFALQIPSPQLYYELLPTHHVAIHGRRGVKIRGLWYDGPGLDGHRGEPSTRGGRHKRQWVVRRDPRDARFVFFQDTDHAWHTLRWSGLPDEGEVPCFGDARVRELLAEARRAGLSPRSDRELLPVLLELIGGHIPVERWPTQMSKPQRTGQAREATQATATAGDRPAQAATRPEDAAPDADVIPLGHRQRARQTSQAIDAERRRRREQAVPETPPPPPRLGENLRLHSRLILPAEEQPPASGGAPDAG